MSFFCIVDQPDPSAFTLKVTEGFYHTRKFVITTPTTPATHVGATYAPHLSTSGGTAPIEWVPSGYLPPGVYFTNTGQFSGKPTQAGSYEFGMEVDQHGIGRWGWAYEIDVYPTSVLPVSISSMWLKPATLGKSYSVTLQGSGGTGTHHWSVTGGALPAGLKLSTSGAITGTPTHLADSVFTVTLSDSAVPASRVTRTFQIPMYGITITPGPSLKDGKVKTFYSQTFHASAGVAPLKWTEVGTLPPGLKLTTGGTLSGTPTVAGTYNFTVTMTDARGNTASAPINVAIS